MADLSAAAGRLEAAMSVRLDGPMDGPAARGRLVEVSLAARSLLDEIAAEDALVSAVSSVVGSLSRSAVTGAAQATRPATTGPGPMGLAETVDHLLAMEARWADLLVRFPATFDGGDADGGVEDDLAAVRGALAVLDPGHGNR